MALSLNQANNIIQNTLKCGAKMKLKPLTVAVVDAGGHLIAFAKEDNSSLFREEIATGKAIGSLGMGVNSRELHAVAKQRPEFMEAAIAASQGKLVPVAGGLLIFDHNMKIIGAVGVSGDISDNDEKCAMFGITESGLKHSITEPKL